MLTSSLFAFVPCCTFISRTEQHLSGVPPMGRRKRHTPGVFTGAVAKGSREILRPPKRKFYAVRQGRDGFSGVLTSWDECTLYVTGVKGAIFKSFKTYEEAHAFALQATGEVGGSSARSYDGSKTGQTESGNITLNRDEEVEYDRDLSHLYKAEPGPEAPKKLCVYTDGACSRNGKVGSKAGYGVFFQEHSPYNVSKPLPGPPTNQRAEMTAVLEAMQIILQHGLVARGGLLEYTKNGIETWTANWKRNNWKTSQRTDVKNKDLWIALDMTKQALRSLSIQVSLIWVKGHRGNPGNEAADRLAVGGMSQSI